MEAKYLYTLGNSYYNEKTFEYKGHTYTVEYSSGYTTFSRKSAFLQHKESQERIDRLIENTNQTEIFKGTWEDTEKKMWEMLEW